MTTAGKWTTTISELARAFHAWRTADPDRLDTPASSAKDANDDHQRHQPRSRTGRGL